MADQYGKRDLMNLWARAGGNPSQAGLMASIALAESSGNPQAHNASGATGLWQILGNPFPGNARDPLTNAKMAVRKLRSQGLGAWEAYTNGAYKQFVGHPGGTPTRSSGGSSTTTTTTPGLPGATLSRQSPGTVTPGGTGLADLIAAQLPQQQVMASEPMPSSLLQNKYAMASVPPGASPVASQRPSTADLLSLVQAGSLTPSKTVTTNLPAVPGTTITTGGAKPGRGPAGRRSPVAQMTSEGGVHPTAGLAGFPARDYFAKPGTTAVAPVTGKVIKLSGHDPAAGPTQGPHGPLGWSVYIKGNDGRTYFLTHMGSRNVKVGQTVRSGQPIGTVANYDKYGTPSHIHMGVEG